MSICVTCVGWINLAQVGDPVFPDEEFAPGVAVALQDLVGGITEVLPSLQNIFVEGLEPSGPFQENIGQFFAARQLSDHPIATSDWDKDSNMSDLDRDSNTSDWDRDSDMEPM